MACNVVLLLVALGCIGYGLFGLYTVLTKPSFSSSGTKAMTALHTLAFVVVGALIFSTVLNPQLLAQINWVDFGTIPRPLKIALLCLIGLAFIAVRLWDERVKLSAIRRWAAQEGLEISGIAEKKTAQFGGERRDSEDFSVFVVHVKDRTGTVRKADVCASSAFSLKGCNLEVVWLE